MSNPGGGGGTPIAFQSAGVPLPIRNIIDLEGSVRGIDDAANARTQIVGQSSPLLPYNVVQDFNVDNTGIVSDIQVANAVAAMIASRVVDEDAGAGFYRITRPLYFPGGRYNIQSAALMGLLADPRNTGTFGYRIFGEPEATRIVYSPPAVSALFTNQNQFLNPFVGGIHFVGGNANAIIAQSFSAGVAQGWTWEKTIVWGQWYECFQKGAFLVGAPVFTPGNPTITLNGHGLTVGQGVTLITGSDTLPPEFASGTRYFVSATGFGPNAFQLATLSGAVITPSTAGTGVHSLYTANGNDTWRFNDYLRVENVNINAANGAVIHEGATAGVIGQDQSIANVIENPNVFTTGGDFLRLDSGGAYEVQGGSIIMKNGSPNCKMFNMPPRSQFPFLGVASFLCHGTRFEIHDATAQVIECHWPFGEVTFDTVTTDGFQFAATQAVATFGRGADRGAVVNWKDCTLTGQHHYASKDNDALGGVAKANYKACQIYSWLDVQDFAVFDVDLATGGQYGGAWVVDFDKDCQCGGQYNVNATARGGPVVPNWTRRMGVDVIRHTRAIATAYGTLPFKADGTQSTVKSVFPRNAIARRVMFDSPNIPGASAVAGWSYTLKTASGITLATLAPGTPWAQGWSESFEIFQRLLDVVIGNPTISIATPGVVTLNAHGRSADDLVKFTTTGALPSPLLPNTPYYVLAAGLTANTFPLGTIPGGGAIPTTGAQSGVHSLIVPDQTLILTSNVINEGHKESVCLVEYLPGY